MSKYHLKICINSLDENTRSLYVSQIEKLRINQLNNDLFQDSGFDLFIPPDGITYPDSSGFSTITTANHKIQCAVYKSYNASGEVIPSAYYLYARSSISKTPYIMANSVGIIDSGYRGDIISKFHYIRNNVNVLDENVKLEDKYNIESGTRMFQLCTPTLEPWSSVEIVENLNETQRGNGGFGSTG